MKNKNIGWYIFSFLFLMFIGFYFNASNGYFETEERKKNTLTEEQIKAFEQDIKDGKQVEITDYLNLNEKEYDNQISSSFLNISSKISETFEYGLNKLFSVMESAMKN